MWWRNAALTLVLCAAAGCGFQPVYGKYSAAQVASAELQDVRIRAIPDRYGQMLTNKLVDRMYTTARPKNPRYELETVLSMQERQLGIQKDATATRGELMVTANVAIYDSETQSELYRTTVRTRVAYNILEGQYGNLIGRENAYERGLNDVADDIVTRTALFLNRTVDAQ